MLQPAQQLRDSLSAIELPHGNEHRAHRRTHLLIEQVVAMFMVMPVNAHRMDAQPHGCNVLRLDAMLLTLRVLQ
jgi:hypothetical protein